MKDYYKYIFPVSIIIILIAISIRDQYEMEYEIAKNEYETISKVSEISRTRNGTRINYYYFYNGEKYTSSENYDYSNQNHSFKFFKVKISSDKPNCSRIQLNEEIRDTTMLINAGFKHIVKTKAEYDYKTNKYNRIRTDYGFQ